MRLPRSSGPRNSAPRIALLTPTFNRSPYLARQLDYLKRFDRSFYRILVLDGSNISGEAAENRALAVHHGVDYQWYDSSEISSYERVLDGIHRADTDYVQLVPDDDYFSDAAFRRHAQMLDESPEAVGAFGHSIGFMRVQSPFYGEFIRLDHASYRNKPDYVFKHPIVRLHYALLEKSRSSYYCLYRSEVAQRIYATTRTYAQIDSVADSRAGSLMDPRAYYFGDLMMTALPVIMGTKVNSGLPSVACELGQSFDTGNPEDIVGPPRQPHYMLPLDETFEYPERVRRFVDGLVTEYKHFHECPDEGELRQFLTNLIMVVVGSTVLTGDWVTRYNRLLGTFSVEPEAMIRTASAVRKPHSVINDEVDTVACAVCGADTDPMCGRVRRDYGFAFDHLAKHHQVSQWQVSETGPVEMEFARTMFSFERPFPYATG